MAVVGARVCTKRICVRSRARSIVALGQLQVLGCRGVSSPVLLVLLICDVADGVAVAVAVVAPA
eukprot:12082272-Alexandrium_andersonii.AAC.1